MLDHATKLGEYPAMPREESHHLIFKWAFEYIRALASVT